MVSIILPTAQGISDKIMVSKGLKFNYFKIVILIIFREPGQILLFPLFANKLLHKNQHSLILVIIIKIGIFEIIKRFQDNLDKNRGQNQKTELCSIHLIFIHW